MEGDKVKEVLARLGYHAALTERKRTEVRVT